MTTTKGYIAQGPNYLPFDIETVANQGAKDYYAKKIYEAPSNYKDPEKIEKYILERRHEDEKKAALSWWTGQIVCINVRSVLRKTSKTFVGQDEAKLLSAFFKYITAEPRGILIGKSNKFFDTPFIIGRCLALDIGIPPFLRPYRPIEDIDECFGYGARADQAGRLDDYAAGLGITPKSGHGTDVQHWFNASVTGKDPEGFKRIAAYCEGDTLIVDEFLRRWSKTWTPDGAVNDVVAPMEIPMGGTPVEEPPAPPTVETTDAPKAKKSRAGKPEPTPVPPPAPVLAVASPIQELEFE